MRVRLALLAGIGEEMSGRREEILDAAAKIFYEKGFSAASMQEVADQVGMLKGSLYHHIDSKDDLLFEVMDRVHEGLVQNWQKHSHSGQGTLEKVREFIRQHVLFTTENLIDIRVFIQDFRALKGDRREIIVTRRDQYEAVLHQLVEQAQREGEVSLPASPRLTTFAIFGMVNWISEWYRPSGGWDANAIADAFADIAIRSMVELTAAEETSASA